MSRGYALAMTNTDVVLQGGPRDGSTFASDGLGLIEIEIDGMVHRYIPTTKHSAQHPVYTYDGMVNPAGAEDGVEQAHDRLASPLADDRDAPG
jgi:hypothetical protein